MSFGGFGSGTNTGFTFGAPPAGASGTTQPSGSTGFSFAPPGQPPAAQGSSGFSFGAPAAPATSASTGSAFGSGGGFSFGQAPATSAAPSTAPPGFGGGGASSFGVGAGAGGSLFKGFGAPGGITTSAAPSGGTFEHGRCKIILTNDLVQVHVPYFRFIVRLYACCFDSRCYRFVFLLRFRGLKGL